MKKVLTVALIVFLLILCTTVLADDERTSGLFTYKLKGNGTVKITGFDWKANGENDIYMPRMIDGYTVTEIGEMAFSSEDANISSPIGKKVVVIIPDTVTIIGEKAFYCTNIQIVQIPSSVEHIGAGAFAGCLNIEEHLVQKGNNTFAVIDGVLYNKIKKELVSYPCNSSATIPDGIKSIGGYAFFECKKRLLPSMFPQSITEIGNYAFTNCYFYLNNDKYASVFDNVRRIGDFSFYGVRFRSSDGYGYGNDFFYFKSVEEIGQYAFYGTEIDCSNSIYFPKTKTMGAYAFCSCKLGSNKIGKSGYAYVPKIRCPELIELGEYAFAEIVPERIPYTNSQNKGKYYEPYVIIDLGDSKLTKIPYRAFYNCSRLYVVNIPETCSVIGEEAFFGVNDNIGGDKLAAYYDSKASRQLGNGLFFKCSIDVMPGDFSNYLPKSIKTIGKGAFENARINFLFEKGTKLETIEDRAFYGAIFADERVMIPNGTRIIGKDVFMNAKNISTIYLPKSIESIGDNLCDRSSVKLEVESGYYGALYASSNGYLTVGEEDDTSWLDD